MASQGRLLGINANAIGNIAWGTHLCIFYKTPEDLPDILGLYFKAGLESNESCLWITSGPSESQEAMAALKSVVNDLDYYIRKGQIEILDASHQWYTGSVQSQADKLLSGLIEKEQQAINRGFDGLRFSGNMFWLESSIWPHIIVEHEANISNIINGRRMIALCSYPITGYEAAKVLDIASSHQITLVKRAGRWMAIERSEHKRTEEALREGEERFRALVETTSDWIWEIDANGAYTYTSPKIKELLGYEPHEVIGKTPFDFMPPEEARRVSNEFATILKSGSSFCSLENLTIHKDGHEVVLETSGVPIFDGRGNLRGYRGIDRDITERKRGEAALLKSEAQYRLLIDNANEAIAVVCDGMIRFANPKQLQLSGYSAEELASKPFIDLIHPDDRQRVVELNEQRQRLRGQPSLVIYPIRVFDKEGNTKWLEVNAVSISWEGRPATLTFSTDITERRRIEEALLNSEAEHRLLAENVNEAIIVACEGILTYVNPAAAEIVGYSGEELTSRSFIDFIYPGDRQKIIERYKLMPSGGSLSGDNAVRVVANDGQTKWVEANAVSISWEGRPASLIFLTDITEHKRLEEALKQSEEKLRAMFESVAEGIAVTDMEGNILETNEAAIRIYGGSKEAFVGLNGFELVAPRDFAKSIEDYNTILREGHIGTRQYSFLRNDGTEYPGEVNVSLIRDVSGKPVGVICINRDITERKRMENALQKSEAEYRLLVENANEAIVVAGDSNLLYTNPKATEITGYPKEELLSKPFVGFIHPDDRQMVLKRHLRRLRGEQLTDVYPIRVVDRDGNTRWVELNSILVSWGNRLATLNFVNEITERKKAEKEAKRSRAELRRLSAHLQSVMERERKRIAHEIHDELGQQLTALKMDLSWIGKNLPKNEKPLTEKIGAMSKYIDTTIDTVRKISTDLRPAILDDFGLLAAIESHLEEFQRRTGIKCTIAPRSSDVDLGQGRNVALFRIVQEALTNVARHANAANAEVSLKERNGSVLLQIKDDGRGVKEEEIASSRSIGIVGMRERARLCKGQMRIKGIVGKGTTVKVSISLKEEKSGAEDISR